MATKKKTSKKAGPKHVAGDYTEALVRDFVKGRKQSSPLKARWAKMKVQRLEPGMIRVVLDDDWVDFEFEKDGFSYVMPNNDARLVPYSQLYYAREYGVNDALFDKQVGHDFIQEDIRDYLYESLEAFAGEPTMVQTFKAATSAAARAKKPWWKLW